MSGSKTRVNCVTSFASGLNWLIALLVVGLYNTSVTAFGFVIRRDLVCETDMSQQLGLGEGIPGMVGYAESMMAVSKKQKLQ